MTTALVLFAIFIALVVLIVVGIGRLSSALSRREEEELWRRDDPS